MASSTTSIQLTDFSSSNNPESASSSAKPTSATNVTTTRRRGQPTTSSAYQDDEDAILQASIAADQEAPDGGYGWLIVAAGAMLLWWGSGTTYAWGVTQRELVDQGLAGPAVLSFIGSLQAAMISAMAVVNTRLMRAVGARTMAMTGMTIMGISTIASSFCTHSLPGLFLTFGVGAGWGASFGFVVVAAIPAQYFSRKRGLANGLIFAGSGWGGAAISVIMDQLIRHVGLPMSLRVLGLLMLVTGLPAGWVFKERLPIAKRSFVEWRLFKTVNFSLLWWAAAIGNFPIFVPPFFLPLYTNALGYSSSTGAGLVAGYTLASAVGRIACGYLCDVLGSINVLLASLVLSALSMLAIWPASQSLGPLALFVVVNGLSNGGFFSTMPTVASSMFGSARVGVIMGMIMTGWIGGYLLGAPIAGYLLEAFGGAEGGLQAYRPAMLYAGSLASLSAGMLLAVRLRINRKWLAKV